MSKGKNKGGFKYGPGRQTPQGSKPQVSPEDKMTIEEAKKILDEKEKILDDAKKEAQEIILSAQREKEAVDSERKQLTADKSEFAERAETLRKDHESQAILDKAEEIKLEAETKATSIIRSAEAKADSTVDSATKQADQLVQKAQSEQERIVNEAQAKASKLLENAVSEAEFQSVEIKKVAQSQAGDILAEAHKQEQIIIAGKEQAAQVRADDIIAQAQNYAERTRESAEKYQQSVQERSDEYEKSIMARAEDDAQKRISHADQVVSAKLAVVEQREHAVQVEEAALPEKAEKHALSVLAARKAEADKRDQAQSDREADLNRQQIEIEHDRRLLDQEKRQFDQRVESQIEIRYGQVLSDLDIQKTRSNQLLDDYTKCKDDLTQTKVKLFTLKREKPDASAAQAAQDEINELNEKVQHMEEALRKYTENGITENRIGEFLGLEAENEQLHEQLNALQQDASAAQIQANRQTATTDQLARALQDKAELEKKVKALQEELDSKKVSRVEMTSPIRQLPVTEEVQDLEIDPTMFKDEVKWLDHIKTQSEKSGITLPMRQFMAYHTSLKIREWSPMVVLAGVSGTGKSELPRQYATHGGMRFVSVPVKPDWDSPSSLFGYYNTIENKFEATELLRYLYQMQSRTGVGNTGSAAPWSKDMLVVLLDEMNLAHPEQYFADMLSKFEEARGSTKDPIYDIALGAGEPVEPLRIGRNVLWTGTMNEDETTKGLSDKVIDRSMLITFPRPTQLISRSTGMILTPEFKISIDRWNLWQSGALHGTESILPDELERLRKIIEEINSSMGKMGRNLGHRVWQSMQHYILNYPAVIASVENEDNLREAINTAFCDAVAFKVMPKFRGLEVEGRNEESFDKIQSCIETNLPDLVVDFQQARDLSSGVFQWSSAEFMR